MKYLTLTLLDLQSLLHLPDRKGQIATSLLRIITCLFALFGRLCFPVIGKRSIEVSQPAGHIVSTVVQRQIIEFAVLLIGDGLIDQPIKLAIVDRGDGPFLAVFKVYQPIQSSAKLGLVPPLSLLFSYHTAVAPTDGSMFVAALSSARRR